MKLSLLKAGIPAPAKNRTWDCCKTAWSRAVKVRTFGRLAAALPLMLLASLLQPALATDLLAGGKPDVEATFGKDSLVVMCIYLAEFVVGVSMYIKTKNPLVLLGMVVLMVFTTVILALIFR